MSHSIITGVMEDLRKSFPGKNIDFVSGSTKEIIIRYEGIDVTIACDYQPTRYMNDIETGIRSDIYSILYSGLLDYKAKTGIK